MWFFENSRTKLTISVELFNLLGFNIGSPHVFPLNLLHFLCPERLLEKKYLNLQQSIKDDSGPESQAVIINNQSFH